jgi:hypothetical protein
MKKQFLIATALILSSSAFTQLTNGLVSQFYFTGGSLTNSVATSSLALTEEGFPSTYGADRDGNANSALTFNGSTGDAQKISIDDSNLELDLATDFSISFWFRSNTLPTQDIEALFSSRQISNSNPGEKGGVDCYINTSGEFEVQFRPFGSGGQIAGINTLKTTSINAGTWYHITITKSGGNVKHFINSNEQSNETITDYPNTNFPSVTYWNIGAFFNTQTGDIYRELNGSMDDIRLYNRALTLQEVIDLYQEIPPVLSLNENHNHALNIFPNPAQDLINIASDTPLKSVIITSIDGKQVYAGQQANTIDISALQSGVYIVDCTLDNNQLVTKRIVKN